MTPADVQLGANTAFVLGNGPSLGKIDLAALSPYRTIGMNAAYRHWERIGWRPTDYACLDLVVGLSHIEGIRTLIREARTGIAGDFHPIQRFLLRQNLIDALGNDADDERIVNFDALRLSTPILQINPVTTGSHALLWASLEGGNPIVLLGIDGKYVELVDGSKRRGGIVLEISEQKANPNYFFEDYQRPGDLYNEPNPRPNLHLEAWYHAASALDGRTTVVNGNRNSEVRNFQFVDPTELITKGSTRTLASETSAMPSAPQGSSSHFVAEALRIYRANPLIFLGPGIAALLAPAFWALGAPTLAILMIAVMLAALITLQLHFGPRRSGANSDASDMALLLGEFARQSRIRRRDTD